MNETAIAGRTQGERDAYLAGFHAGVDLALTVAKPLLDERDREALEHSCASLLHLTDHPDEGAG